MKFSKVKQLIFFGLVLSGSMALSHASYADETFRGIPIQGPLTSIQLTQLTSREEDREIKGGIKISWLQSFQDLGKLAKIKKSEAVSLGNKAGLGLVYKAKLEEEDDYLVWELGIIGNHGHLMKLTLDAGNGKALKFKLKDREDED
jgi:hypothetical protein